MMSFEAFSGTSADYTSGLSENGTNADGQATGFYVIVAGTKSHVPVQN